MKRILILLLALMPVVAGAQELNIDNDMETVTWSMVYQTDLSQADIYKQILAYGLLENVVTFDDMIAGDIHPVKLDYDAAGYHRMKVPLYLSNGWFCGRIILQFKEGRYKATAVDMYFRDSESPIYSTTSLYSGVDEFGFSVSTELIMEHLSKITTFTRSDDEW